MFCYKCGSPMPDTARFCTQCAADMKLFDEQAAVESAPAEPTPAPVQPAPAPVQPAPAPVQQYVQPTAPTIPIAQPPAPTAEMPAVSADPSTVNSAPVQQFVQQTVQVAPIPSAPAESAAKSGTATGKRNIVILIIAAILIAAGAFAAILLMGGTDKKNGGEDSLLLAESYLSEKKYDEAAAEYKKVLSTDPDNVGAMIGMSQALDAQGESAKAEEMRADINEILDIEEPEPETPAQTTFTTQSTTQEPVEEIVPEEEEKTVDNSHTEELSNDEFRELIEYFGLFDFSTPITYSEFATYVTFDDINDVSIFYLTKAVYPYLAEGAHIIREGEHGTEYVIARKGLIKLINKYIGDGYDLPKENADSGVSLMYAMQGSGRCPVYDSASDTYTIDDRILSNMDLMSYNSVVLEAYKKGDVYYLLASDTSDIPTEKYVLDSLVPYLDAPWYHSVDIYTFERDDEGRFKIRSKNFLPNDQQYPPYLEMFNSIHYARDITPNSKAILCDIDKDGGYEMVLDRGGSRTIEYSKTLIDMTYSKLVRNDASDITLIVSEEDHSDKDNGVLASNTTNYMDKDRNILFTFTAEKLYVNDEIVANYYVNHVQVTAEEYNSSLQEVEKAFTEYVPETVYEFGLSTPQSIVMAELMKLCPFQRP